MNDRDKIPAEGILIRFALAGLFVIIVFSVILFTLIKYFSEF